MEFETFNLTDLYTISSGLSKNRKYFGTGTPFLTCSVSILKQKFL
ncbi:TPA: hypothetical protein ACHH9B_000518 [Staphylococcus aureus]